MWVTFFERCRLVVTGGGQQENLSGIEWEAVANRLGVRLQNFAGGVYERQRPRG
jgi:hypothetical protein